MAIEALNCPNCGGGVSSDSPQCEFCKTRLKTMACPSCFGLMFVGAKFCGHCGEEMIAAVTEDEHGQGTCPRCTTRLARLEIGRFAFRECGRCSGLWADVEMFEDLCADREEQAAVLVFIGERNTVAAPPAKITYVPCPDCGQLMNRSNFARASGVIIDVCRQHGVWFDADELPRIIEFISKGGLELARKKERLEIDDQRRQLREEQRRYGVEEQRSGIGAIFEKDDEPGIRSLIRKLFD